MKIPCISIVVAMGDGNLHNHVIGKDNQLLWHIPDDLKRFRKLTLGHPVIMGRKTFQSIIAVLGKPLPRRTSIVVTRDTHFHYENVLVAHSLEQALEKACEIETEEIFIGGGTEIYTQALPFVDRLYLTLINDDKEGDSVFPDYEKDFTQKIFEETREWEGLTYQWVTLERK